MILPKRVVQRLGWKTRSRSVTSPVVRARQKMATAVAIVTATMSKRHAIANS